MPKDYVVVVSMELINKFLKKIFRCKVILSAVTVVHKLDVKNLKPR